MTFEFEGLVFNWLDTAGHMEIFRRHLSKRDGDSRLRRGMVIDAAKGASRSGREKLSEVCRLRDIPHHQPSSTRWTARGRDTFILLDENRKDAWRSTPRGPMTLAGSAAARDSSHLTTVANGGVRLARRWRRQTGEGAADRISSCGRNAQSR